MTTQEKTAACDGLDRESAPSIDRAEALLIVVVVLSLGACGWVASAITAPHATASVEQAARTLPPEQPEYFPAGYVNQSGEIPEHIQAF